MYNINRKIRPQFHFCSSGLLAWNSKVLWKKKKIVSLVGCGYLLWLFPTSALVVQTTKLMNVMTPYSVCPASSASSIWTWCHSYTSGHAFTIACISKYVKIISGSIKLNVSFPCWWLLNLDHQEVSIVYVVYSSVYVSRSYHPFMCAILIFCCSC